MTLTSEIKQVSPFVFTEWHTGKEVKRSNVKVTDDGITFYFDSRNRKRIFSHNKRRKMFHLSKHKTHIVRSNGRIQMPRYSTMGAVFDQLKKQTY